MTTPPPSAEAAEPVTPAPAAQRPLGRSRTLGALLAVEWARLRARPLVRAAAVAAALAALAAGIGTLAASHPDSPAHLHALQAQQRQAIERCVTSGFNPPVSQVAQSDRREFCANEAIPAPPYTFQLTSLLDLLEGAGGKGSAGPLVVVALLLGASLVGADWHSGQLATQLLWEPRRLRVLAAKVTVAAVAITVGVLAAQALLGAALLPAALLRGSTAGATAGWFGEVAGAALRVAVLAGLAAGIGACLASVGRRTAAALATVAVYGLVELFARGFENPTVARWLLGENAAVFVTAGRAPAQLGRSTLAALAILLAVAIGSFALAAASFLQRDIT